MRSRGPKIAQLAIVLGAAALSPSTFATEPSARLESVAAEPSAATRRNRELDQLRRQDLVDQLATRGVAASAEKQDLAQLTDWRDRIDAARSLGAQIGIQFDWRSLSLPALTDMRLRVSKTAELQARYGIDVDWRRYSWADLERLRVSLVALRPSGTPRSTSADADALAPFDPGRHVMRARPALHDPDAIFEPLFASTGTARVDNTFLRGRTHLDPDAMLTPTFRKIPSRTGEPYDRGNDLIDPWPAR